jgi:hypothetical protein
VSAIVIIIPVYNAVALRLATDADLREQYQRECDALDHAMREPPPRTRPIALPSRTDRGLR